MPTIESVSPAAHRRLKKADYIGYANTFFLALAIAVAIGDSQDDNFETQEAFYGLLGLSWAGTFYESYETRKALKQYNQDLRMRFVPKITLFTTEF